MNLNIYSSVIGKTIYGADSEKNLFFPFLGKHIAFCKG